MLIKLSCGQARVFRRCSQASVGVSGCQPCHSSPHRGLGSRLVTRQASGPHWLLDGESVACPQDNSGQAAWVPLGGWVSGSGSPRRRHHLYGNLISPPHVLNFIHYKWATRSSCMQCEDITRSMYAGGGHWPCFSLGSGLWSPHMWSHTVRTLVLSGLFRGGCSRFHPRQ